MVPFHPLDIEVNGFNGGVLNGVPSAYHWYTERYGVKWPCGYDLNISSQGENFNHSWLWQHCIILLLSCHP